MDSEPRQKLPRRPDLERSKRIQANILRLYKLSDESTNNVLEDIFRFSNFLRKKYPRGTEENVEKYAIFHDLIGSSIGEDSEALYPGIIYDKDIAGDDSIEKFIDDLIKKYIDKK